MTNYGLLMLKSEDVFCLMKALRQIGWKYIKESSINRVMYLSAVLYTFRYSDNKNIFENDYKFTITLSGPEDPDIEKALVNLDSNDVVSLSELGYCLLDGREFSFAAKQTHKKEEWFGDIAYLLGIYGEDKIYDFIFRDKEYRDCIQGNSIYNLNIGRGNATVRFLNDFKGSFEKQLCNQSDALDNRQYLELYFEYIFGKILRGES